MNLNGFEELYTFRRTRSRGGETAWLVEHEDDIAERLERNRNHGTWW